MSGVSSSAQYLQRRCVFQETHRCIASPYLPGVALPNMVGKPTSLRLPHIDGQCHTGFALFEIDSHPSAGTEARSPIRTRIAGARQAILGRSDETQR